MDVTSSEIHNNNSTDRYPLLMERMEGHDSHDHVISITGNNDASLGSEHGDSVLGSSEGLAHPALSSSSVRLNSRNSTYTRRGDAYGHQRTNPVNTGLWISIELLVSVGQIIASIVVLSISKNESPHAPLFVWVLGYACGCVATVPILCWRLLNRSWSAQRDSLQSSQGSSQSNPTESASYRAISGSQDEENFNSTESATRIGRIAGSLSARLNILLDHFKLGIDCFFAVWFVVGNVWIFGSHTTPTDAPQLYKLCIVFLTFSCIGYAMPFIICATICCCFPCIVSIIGIRDNLPQTRGATDEFIKTLPTYKFTVKNTENMVNDGSRRAEDGGVLAAGTEHERPISGEDAVCCICLNKYVDNDELRDLPCTHVFHVDCVDKWLKINASCPLCKSEIGDSGGSSSLGGTPANPGT